MKASGLDIAVMESPKTCAIGEKKAWTIDFAAVGTPSSVIGVTAYDPSGTDVSATFLDGATSINGTVVTLKAFTPPGAPTPAAEGMYLIVCEVNIGNNEIMGGVYVAVFPVVHAPAVIGTKSYGSPAGVASLVPRYATKSGTFNDTTRPSQVEVIDFIDQVSSVLNVQFAQYGFTVPITDPDLLPMLDMFVQEEVAAICEGINGMGRFSPRSKYGGGSRFKIVFRDVAEFLEKYANGIANMGAARPETLASGIGYRDTDVSGQPTFPLFQRKGFGDNEAQRDWDT